MVYFTPVRFGFVVFEQTEGLWGYGCLIVGY